MFNYPVADRGDHELPVVDPRPWSPASGPSVERCIRLADRSARRTRGSRFTPPAAYRLGWARRCRSRWGQQLSERCGSVRVPCNHADCCGIGTGVMTPVDKFAALIAVHQVAVHRYGAPVTWLQREQRGLGVFSIGGMGTGPPGPRLLAVLPTWLHPHADRQLQLTTPAATVHTDIPKVTCDA